MIKDEIKYKQQELVRLKQKYKTLVEDIKKTFFDKVDYWVDDSPRKPSGEKYVLQAALCLVEGKCPRYSFNLDLRQAKSWAKGKEDKWLDYFIINQERFDFGNGIPATIVIRKKNLKLLTDICQKLWVKQISDSFGPKTKLGFEEWLDETSVDKILELMIENFNSHKGNRVFHVTDKNLYVKDVVIIYPQKIIHSNSFF
jgi:hypothetical protein